MMRKRRLIAMAMLGALSMVALALPAGANDDDDHDRRDGQHRPSLGAGGKLTVALLERGESQSLAEVYASEDTGRKVERPMRRGLIRYCHPGGYDTVSFTCEGATGARTPPETTTTTGTGTTTGTTGTGTTGTTTGTTGTTTGTTTTTTP
jgi:hypothetical protein